MRFLDLPDFGSTRALLVRVLEPAGAPSLAPGDEVRIHAVDGDFFLRRPDQEGLIRVEADDTASRHALQDLLHHDVPLLSWVEKVISQKTGARLALGTRRFTGRRILEQPLKIHVDRRILEDIARRLRAPDLTAKQATPWLESEFILPPPSAKSKAQHRFILRPGNDDQSPFLMIGESWRLKVGQRPGGGWRAEALIRPKGEPEDARWLVEGTVEFGDFPDGADAGALAELEMLRRSNAGYLALWQSYEKLEWEALHRRAKEFGQLPYTAVRRRANGDWEFALGNAPTEEQVTLARWGETSLAVAGLPPDYLTSPLPVGRGGDRAARPPDLRGDCILLGKTSLVLRPDPNSSGRGTPRNKGCIFLDLSGDSAALARRGAARERIVANLTGVPLFGWLEGHPVGSRAGRHHEALSPEVKRLFGKYAPTPRQIEAIDIALNTPDIAVIQGPPGTGKTRVIAAILTRLAEISEKEDRGSDKNLLTSFQHDAVENAAAVSGVNGLPPIKFGRKRGKEASTLAVDAWRHEHVKKLNDALAHRTHRPRRLVLEELRKRRLAYLQAPGTEAGAAALLEEAASLARDLLSPNLELEMQATATRLRRGDAPDAEVELLRKAAEGLRTSAAAFSDDGPQSAFRLMKRLQEAERLDADTQTLLERASRWDSQSAPPFLPELERLRERVLDQITAAPPKTAVTLLNADVAKLLERAVKEAEAKVATLPDEGLDLVLARLRSDLESNPEALRDTLGRYTVILAATCQQSVGKAMLEHLETGDDFATVVVDEAARANPLDLLIPMSRARRRIILVGDHRQLPHMLEPDVERELERSLTAETKAAMQQSLFERLFEAAKRQQAHDHIKRWVTLDAQYRMHPVLGRFVSRVFYERHGGGERFDSPAPAENYLHPLVGPFGGKVAGWKDLPPALGPEEPHGTSWRRRAEARWIAGEAKRIMDAHPALSVGVISFYAAQVNCILEEMCEIGLVERDRQEGLRISPQYEKTTNERGEPTERLRVGSVDAFQGKEFDVVLLSFTRCNAKPAGTLEDLRRKLGHLLLENRLCVAMSRQRRLLIVAGDRRMIEAPAVAEAAPGLTEFMKLCETEAGVVFP